MTRRAALLVGVVASLGMLAGYRAVFVAPALPADPARSVASLIADRCLPFINRGMIFAANGLQPIASLRRTGRSFMYLETGVVVTTDQVDAGQACFIENGAITWDIAARETLFADLPEIATNWIGSGAAVRPLDNPTVTGWIARTDMPQSKFIMWGATATGDAINIALGIANFEDGVTS